MYSAVGPMSTSTQSGQSLHPQVDQHLSVMSPHVFPQTPVSSTSSWDTMEHPRGQRAHQPTTPWGSGAKGPRVSTKPGCAPSVALLTAPLPSKWLLFSVTRSRSDLNHLCPRTSVLKSPRKIQHSLCWTRHACVTQRGERPQGQPQQWQQVAPGCRLRAIGLHAPLCVASEAPRPLQGQA